MRGVFLSITAENSPHLRATNGYMHYIKNGLLIKMQIAALQEHTVNKEVSWFRMCIIYFISQ